MDEKFEKRNSIGKPQTFDSNSMRSEEDNEYLYQLEDDHNEKEAKEMPDCGEKNLCIIISLLRL